MNETQLDQMIRKLDAQAEGTPPEWRFKLAQRRLICTSASQQNRLAIKVIVVDVERLSRSELLSYLADNGGDESFCVLDGQLCAVVHHALAESNAERLLTAMHALAAHAEQLAPAVTTDRSFANNPPDWAALLKTLSDDTRLRLIAQLLRSEQSVEELANRLDLTHYNTSKHLRILRESGIVESHKQGRLVVSCIAAAFRLRVKNQVLDLGCCRFDFAQFIDK